VARRNSPHITGRSVGKSKDLEDFVQQSFHLLFGDEYLNMPLKLLMIFKGELKRNYGNRDFIESEETQGLRYLILQSGRLAFHWALEAFVMGEMELSDHKTFEVSNF
jgi:hypothetical protein